MEGLDKAKLQALQILTTREEVLIHENPKH